MKACFSGNLDHQAPSFCAMLGAGSFFLAPEWGLRDQEDGVPSFGLLRFPRHLMETSRSFWPAFWAACVLTVLVLALGHFLKPTNPVSTAGKMEMVGPFQPGGKVRHVTPDNHVLTPAGIQVELLGFRPNALALSPDGKLLVAAGTAARLICVDPGTGQILEEVSLPAKDQVAPAAVSANILAPDGRAKLSFTGLIFSPDGTRLFLSNVNGSIKVFSVERDQKVVPSFTIPLPPAGTTGRNAEIPSGLAISGDGWLLYVALNLSNGVAEVEISSGKVLRRWETGIAPYDVALVRDRLYVSNWGGRRPAGEEATGLAGQGVRI